MEPNQKQTNNMETEGFHLLPLELIDDPARPMRSDLTLDSVQDLVMSIKQVGILEPLLVTSKDGRYEVIAGHRRLMAAQAAGLNEAPCIVRKVGNEEKEIMKIHENMFREDISPFDEAKHFDYLIQHLKLSPAKVASLIGRSPTFVSERLAIFNYPPELRQALIDKKIVFSVARTFGRHPDPEKIRTFLRYAVSNGITPTLAEKWVKDDIATTQPKPQGGGASTYTESDRQPESAYYHCYLCTDGVDVVDVIPVYLHSACDKQFRAATASTAPSAPAAE
jgi:ParB family chromosome partitioning protein